MSLILEAQDTPVIAKAKELCETILAQDKYKALRSKMDAFMSNDASQSLFQKFMDQRDYLAHLQEQGIALTEEQIAGFNGERDKLLADPIANGYIEARQEMNDLADTVITQIEKTIELGRMPTADELSKKGGCCGGGCGSGGGGCG